MIQIITYSGSEKYQSKQIYVSKLESPQSLDEYDYNFIDLRDGKIWFNMGDTINSINCIATFKHINSMISHSRRMKTIVILPQDCDYYYKYFPHSKSYANTLRLRDMIDSFSKLIFKDLIGINTLNILYENTTTVIYSDTVNASFYFEEYNKVLTQSNHSNKVTTTEYENVIFTTLNIQCNELAILQFLKAIGLLYEKQSAPDWFNEIQKFDDEELKNDIDSINRDIVVLKTNLEQKEKLLSINNLYKSILYTNSDELVQMVYKILEELFSSNLSDFIDEKKEDFIIEKEKVTFVGEIKGVSSNVKNEHVSQVDVHVQTYMDCAIEQGNCPELKGLLIINTQRNRPPKERDEIGQNQIRLAKRNESLIITTVELLDLYEKFKNNQVSSEEIINTFSETIGLFQNSII